MKNLFSTAHYYIGIWVTWAFLLAWLPFLRSIFDGTSYHWGTSRFGFEFSGSGLGGDWWYMLLKLAIGFVVMFGVWLRQNWGYWVALLLTVIFVMDSAWTYWVLQEPNMFRGDTLGIAFDMTYIALGVNGLAVLAAAALVGLSHTSELAHPRVLRAPQRMLWLLAVLPIQFLLLRTEPSTGLSDQIGVLITISQWAMLPVFIHWSSIDT